jgi:hypothetical protein
MYPRVHSEGDVLLRRKLLRSVLSDDIIIELKNLGDFNAVDAYEVIQKKMVGFENVRKQAGHCQARGLRPERII